MYISSIFPTWELRQRKIKWYDRRQQWYSWHNQNLLSPQAVHNWVSFLHYQNAAEIFVLRDTEWNLVRCRYLKLRTKWIPKYHLTKVFEILLQLKSTSPYRKQNTAFSLNLVAAKRKLSYPVLCFKGSVFLCDQVLKSWSSFLYSHLELLYTGRSTNVLLLLWWKEQARPSASPGMTLHVHNCVYNLYKLVCSPYWNRLYRYPTTTLLPCALQWLSLLEAYTDKINELWLITLERLYLLLQSKSILF